MRPSETTSAPNGNGSSLAGRYLTLTLGNESCAIPVHRVREIIRFPSFPGVCAGVDSVEGLIHLRGRRIPVLDLRVAFGLPPTPTTPRTCIVVVQVPLQHSESQLAGLVVDAVEEIIHVTDAQIGEPPVPGSRLDPAFLLGMARVEGAVSGLLDIDRAAARCVHRPVQQRHGQPGGP